MAIRPELCALLGSSVADMPDAPADDESGQVILPDDTRTFQTLFEYAPDAMWIFDDAGRYLKSHILRKHGYPPDKQARATELVLEQAEVLSELWAVA